MIINRFSSQGFDCLVSIALLRPRQTVFDIKYNLDPLGTCNYRLSVSQFRLGPDDPRDNDFRHTRSAVHVAVDVRLPAELCATVLQHGLAETSGKVIIVKPLARKPFSGASGRGSQGLKHPRKLFLQ